MDHPLRTNQYLHARSILRGWWYTTRHVYLVSRRNESRQQTVNRMFNEACVVFAVWCLSSVQCGDLPFSCNVNYIIDVIENTKWISFRTLKWFPFIYDWLKLGFKNRYAIRSNGCSSMRKGDSCFATCHRSQFEKCQKSNLFAFATQYHQTNPIVIDLCNVLYKHTKGIIWFILLLYSAHL